MAKNSKTEILKRIKGKFESLNRENGELKRQIDDQTEVIDSLNRTVVNKEEEIYRNGGPDALKELEGTKAELEFLRSSLDLTDASVKESVELGGQLWCLLMKSSGTQVVIAASEISTDVEFPKPTYSDLQEELDSLRRESALNVSEYEEQLKAAHENFERFKNRSSAITKQSASYQSLSAVRGEQVLALEREIEELKTDLANAQQPGDCTREQELESCLEENERQAVSLNAQVSLLTEQLAKAKSDVHSVEHAELRKLRHEQSQNEGQIASLGESLHTYAEKITELQNKLHVERTASRALASDLEALRLKAETPGPSVVLEAVSPLTEPGSEPETTENVHFLASDNQSRRLRDSLTKLEIELQDTRSERSMMHEQVKLLQGELRNAEAVSNLHSSVNTKPVNAEYLRNTLIRFLETGRITSSEHESLVPVICHLLSVSAEQAKTIEEKRRANAGFTRFFGL
ncbi:MAG: uncharacterized protein KVP18_000770 [Porospora cf. gigantea A]|nr:MAG: hypothetical protein KVP18_000770 [Porospora cf. gigantea A]